MTLQQATQKTHIANKLDELILVVKTSALFPDTAPQGIHPVDFKELLALINQKKEFLPRGLMEVDTTFKQIIPYLIFTHNDQYFLMQRSATASETRLQNNYSLGIGGHVRQEDLAGATLFDWAEREFNEEIAYNGTLECEPIGILNDDSNEVGKVHLGLVMLLHGDSSDIAIRSELKSGTLVPLEECMLLYKDMESWSKIVLKFLLDRTYGNAPQKCCGGH